MKSTLTTRPWIEILTELANTSGLVNPKRSLNHSLLRDIDSCYDYCNKVTAFHSKSFFLASGLLPSKKRKAIRSLYAFCRTTDDIIDMEVDFKEKHIDRWSQDTTGHQVRFNDPVAIAWADTRMKYKIPNIYASQLIEGVIMDLSKHQYANFHELTRYCYHVASSVGLMVMHIVGFKSEEATPYAIKLGVALQLTNILRDIEEDWQRGRIYLPQDEMDHFGITHDHFRNKINDDRWKAFMRFQIQRARRIYQESWPGISMLHKDGRLAIAAAATFYNKILDRIEEQNYDVFGNRASVSKWGKMKMIPELFMKYKYSLSIK